MLIVDDDPDIREALSLLLQDESARCIEVGNGAEALELLRRGEVRPDVILLDLMMPIMDGWSFRAAQLADPDLAAIPVVLLTANNVGADRAAEMGIRHMLRKPPNLDVLFEKIRHFTPGWQPG